MNEIQISFHPQAHLSNTTITVNFLEFHFVIKIKFTVNNSFAATMRLLILNIM